PKGAKNAPILLTRTPYDATSLTSHAASAHLGPILNGYDNTTEVIVEGGYIRVVQDVRGKYDSEGDYVMNRPLHGPLNPTPVDHSTATWKPSRPESWRIAMGWSKSASGRRLCSTRAMTRSGSSRRWIRFSLHSL